jgi:N6-adenosine-specific RNA methylase IME4
MGKLKTDNTVRQLIEAERTKHSKKPKEARERIEQLFAGANRIELFARENHVGWDAWGNEVEICTDLSEYCV